MILELIEEIKPSTGTMYAVIADGLTVKWFVHKEAAEKYYNEVLSDPSVLKSQTNILQSQEISLSLDK